MRIDIWSDVVCPWCYLGKRRFEQALEQFDGRAGVEIAHRSFQLDPTKPRGQTANRRQMLMSKYRLSDAQVREMDAKMERLATADGLEYHLTEAGLTGNTLDAHRLVHLAADHDRADAMLDRLYRAYFTDQQSVFDVEALVPLAASVGLDEEEARATLQTDRYADAVERDLAEARSLGVSGVPFFVIDGRYGISGAQSVEAFGQALAQASEKS